MVTFVVIGAIAGALMSMRLKVLALIPVIFVATVVVILIGHHIGQHVLAIALYALATIAALQIGYMLGCVVRAKVPAYPAVANALHLPSAVRKVH